MNRLVVFTLCLVSAAPAAARHAPDPVEPTRVSAADLLYKYDGDDLIVTLPVTLFDAPHVVLTSLDPCEIYPPILRYTIIQNADHALQGKKTVSIEWRFPGHGKRGLRPGMVKGLYLVLYTHELNQLGGAALKLTKNW